MTSQAIDQDEGISIVCVYNDPQVRAECLDRSVQAYLGDLDVDYIPVDNRTQTFSTAGAALNHGARLARHELVVFVHQDVYLHSIDRLVWAARAFGEEGWGVLGANGVTSLGLNVGRLRDRTQLIGVHAPTPVEVDSLDEVLFMVPRHLVLEHPLSESDELAWHAYGVEYCLRMRSMGLRAGAVDLAVTHNSLTINLARLDAAHRAVGRQHPKFLPIRTTCGTIGGRATWLRSQPIVRRHGWRLRWLRHSLLAARAARWVDGPVVLSDIRSEVDLLTKASSDPLNLVNVDGNGGFVEFGRAPLTLTRYGRPVVMRAVRAVSEVAELVAELPPGEVVLIVGLGLSDLRDLRSTSSTHQPWLLGIHPAEMWLLGGVPVDQLPLEWRRSAALPLGSRKLEDWVHVS
ncbi:hypothetical protein [uncultured Friedmanniella sp.]|uniref:hypothetical protein n=1 Tax=uncultured Friedmanniella sp. TaxID=335381 RepID=UPI0035CA9199